MNFPLTHAELREIGLRLDLKPACHIEQIGDSHYRICTLTIPVDKHRLIIWSDNITGRLIADIQEIPPS